MSHLAFGALRGVRTLWGRPGTAAAAYARDPSLFELDLPPSPELWVAGPAAGLALLSLNAWLSSRKVLRASPASTLRDAL